MVTQAFSALEKGELPKLKELKAGDRIYLVKTDGTCVRFSHAPDDHKQFYTPQHSFRKVTARLQP